MGSITEGIGRTRLPRANECISLYRYVFLRICEKGKSNRTASARRPTKIRTCGAISGAYASVYMISDYKLVAILSL